MHVTVRYDILNINNWEFDYCISLNNFRTNISYGWEYKLSKELSLLSYNNLLVCVKPVTKDTEDSEVINNLILEKSNVHIYLCNSLEKAIQLNNVNPKNIAVNISDTEPGEVIHKLIELISKKIFR